MNTSLSSASRFSFGIAILASLGLLAGCAPVVIDGDDHGQAGNDLSEVPGDDNNAIHDDEPVSNVGNGGEAEAIAIRYSEIPTSNPGSGSSSSSGGGSGPHPDTLFIKISDQPVACNDPHAAQECGGHWRVSIGIPPALQVPGVIDLASPEVLSYSSATGPGSGADCWFGGGSFMEGTLEILSIDADKVVVRLENTWTYDFDANGEYSAMRCF